MLWQPYHSLIPCSQCKVNFKVTSNSTSNSLQTHFKLTSNSLQSHFKPTSNSLQSQLQSQLQTHFKVTSKSLQTHFKLTVTLSFSLYLTTEPYILASAFLTLSRCKNPTSSPSISISSSSTNLYSVTSSGFTFILLLSKHPLK